MLVLQAVVASNVYLLYAPSGHLLLKTLVVSLSNIRLRYDHLNLEFNQDLLFVYFKSLL